MTGLSTMTLFHSFHAATIDLHDAQNYENRFDAKRDRQVNKFSQALKQRLTELEEKAQRCQCQKPALEISSGDYDVLDC